MNTQILECLEYGAGSCRNKDMILELTAERDAARAEADALREQILQLKQRMCCSCHETTNDNVLCEACYEDLIA